MRLNLILFRHARSPQNEKKVPFKELHPLKLKDRIDKTANDTLEDKCLFEMSLLFRCWKENEFNQSLCTTFEKQLKQCYKTLHKTMETQLELRKRTVPTPDTTNLTSKQLTYLLRQYPNV